LLNKILEDILEWAELWVLILPIIAIIRTRKQPPFMYPVIIYVFVALGFNCLVEMVGVLYNYLSPSHRTNTIFYNTHSLCRFICFTAFFFSISHIPFKKLYYWLVGIFCLIFILYFSMIDSFFNPKHISSDLMTGEAFFLLCFCMLYYLNILREEPQSFWARKDFWVVTGLCFFSAINFFLFLFYLPLLAENTKNAENIWAFFNVSFIIFILFLTKAFYVPASNKH
jgi:hypothetical protein